MPPPCGALKQCMLAARRRTVEASGTGSARGPRAMRVEELWVFPVKGCRGVRVAEATLTSTGLALDRAWLRRASHGAERSGL